MSRTTSALTGHLNNIRLVGGIVKPLSSAICFKAHFMGVFGFSIALPLGLNVGRFTAKASPLPPLGTVGKLGSTPIGRDNQQKLRGFLTRRHK